MEVQYRMEKEILYVTMPKEVDHHVAKSMGKEIDFLIGSWRARKLIFDFSNTEFMDSSVIGVVIGRHRTMELYKGEVCAINLNVRAKQIFNKSGLSKIVFVEGE